jgi:hypothetical protein
MPRLDDVSQIRNILLHRARAVRDDAIETDGAVPADELRALERLSRLVQLCEAARPPATRKRWPIVVALGITLVIVSVLLFSRVSETEVELDLTTSGVGFVLSREQALSDLVNLSALGASGQIETRIPPPPVGFPDSARASDQDRHRAINLAIDPDATRESSITLAALILPDGTRVGIAPTDIARQYRLALRKAGLELRVDVNGSIIVTVPGGPAQKRQFSSPKSIVIKSGAEYVNLDVSLPDTAKQSNISHQIFVSDLSLFSIEEFSGLQHTLVRRRSTVLSGAVYLESLNGKELTLRPGASLRFERSNGEIRTISLSEEGMTLKFHGHVTDMSTGSEDNPRNLMPTYLEWLRARHGLSLFWGAMLYLLTLAVGLLRWWGITV